jgi:AcrR family transcriptional regulator
MAERWTRERRVEHTRTLLLAAAEEVFAKKGFGGASLDDIADVAGYTRGAIHSHFGTKEALFVAVTEQHRQKYLDAFADVISSFHDLGDLDVGAIADRWRQLSSGPEAAEHAALGFELTLFLQRNPELRDRLAEQRLETFRSLGEFIEKGIARLGGTLRFPGETLARLLITTSDAIILGSHLDGDDLYLPFMTMFLSAIERPT